MSHPQPPRNSDVEFVHPEDTQAREQAAELFVHGVMLQLYQDTPLEKERRIQRVMAELASPARTTSPFWSGNILKFSRAWLASAAALALFVSMVYVGISTEKSADATVAASIQAMRDSGDRRFEVRAKLHTDADLSTEPLATIDTRAPGLMLLKSKGLDAKLAPGMTVGRDADGVWAIRGDGTIERDNPEQRWPRWSMLGEESLFADSVDQLLETLSKAYVIKNSEPSKLEGRGDVKFTHLTGNKKLAMQPGPKQIDVWIDPETKVVERIEIRFEKPPQEQPGGPNGPNGPGGPGGPGPNGDGRRPEFDGPGPGGPPDGRRPEFGPGGPPPGGEGRRPDRLPEGVQPDDGRPIGPPFGDGLPERADRGPRGDRPDPDHPGEFRGPPPNRGGKAQGPGQPQGGPGRIGPHFGPRGRPDPMRGPRGGRLPPLELLVIDRVTPPTFTEGYFDAAKYASPMPDGTEQKR